MTRTLVTITILLAAALALEVAILPQFLILRTWADRWFDGRSLLPLVGLLIGLLRGEIQGMLVAGLAACLFGFSQPPGQLGASIFSFTLIAFLGGVTARSIQLYGIPTRWVIIAALLIVERLAWWMVRRFFWESSTLLDLFHKDISWPALGLGALLGCYLYKWLSPKMRLWLYIDT